LLEAVRSVFARLPEVFDRNDVCEALGYEPDRSSLFRVLQELERQGELALESRGGGKIPTLYRHPGANAPSAGV
jgi:prophage antirepressor-like protein